MILLSPGRSYVFVIPYDNLKDVQIVECHVLEVDKQYVLNFYAEGESYPYSYSTLDEPCVELREGECFLGEL